MANFGIPKPGIKEKYFGHNVFELLKELKSFYTGMLFNDNTSTIAIVENVINFNSKIYESISNTIDSISILLSKGHISDAASLMRKYNDAVTLHVLLHILSDEEQQKMLEESHTMYDNIVNSWVYGRGLLMKQEDSIIPKLKDKDEELTRILFNHFKIYNKGRTIGDDNVHYNTWEAFMINCHQIMDYELALRYLDDMNSSIRLIFSIHFACLAIFNPMSMIDEEAIQTISYGQDTEYYVTPFVSDMFSKHIKAYDFELAHYLEQRTTLHF